MKKHELIKAAYDNFPKGSKFHWGGFPITSTGEFHFNDETIVTSGSDIEYQVFDGKKFASLVKESILSGKCAIQVNNEREFKLLMEHYEGKGWKWEGGDNPSEPIPSSFTFPNVIMYKDEFLYNPADPESWKIIPFNDFAAEVVIEVPVFVMTSEDGVPLYKGDEFIHVSNRFEDKWALNDGIPFRASKTHVVFEQPETDKAFSNKESADKWCKEMNKPKSIDITSLHGQFTVTKTTVSFMPFNTCVHFMELSGSFFDKIVEARKSLQP